MISYHLVDSWDEKPNMKSGVGTDTLVSKPRNPTFGDWSTKGQIVEYTNQDLR
jgi:hypothetical protein